MSLIYECNALNHSLQDEKAQPVETDCTSGQSTCDHKIHFYSDRWNDTKEILSKAVSNRVSIFDQLSEHEYKWDEQKCCRSNEMEPLEDHVRNRLIQKQFCFSSQALGVVPRPPLPDRSSNYEGVASLSGIILMSIVLKNKTLEVYRDFSREQLQFKCDLRWMLSLHSSAQQYSKSVKMICFRVVLGLREVSSDPGLVPIDEANKNVRIFTLSHTFAVQRKYEHVAWTTKIIQSLTNAFPESLLKDFTIFGWCYVRNSESTIWYYAWVLLIKRDIYIYCDHDRQLQRLDLRKARCIREVNSDDSIKMLPVEPGPLMFIDCSPYKMVHYIMGTAKQTQNWVTIAQESSWGNGDTLDGQQLTENDVPVLIEKCIHFINAHGCRSEGIHRVSGTFFKINNLLDAFKKNAFEVQLFCDDYEVQDVTSALRKFIRDSSSSMFGNYSDRFMNIVTIESITERVYCYKKLLTKLSSIEYNTLKMVIGHLKFIASQEQYNKMGVHNLAIIWSTTLLSSFDSMVSDNVIQNSKNEIGMVSDLISYYGDIFTDYSENPYGQDKLYEDGRNRQTIPPLPTEQMGQRGAQAKLPRDSTDIDSEGLIVVKQEIQEVEAYLGSERGHRTVNSGVNVDQEGSRR